jgi:hypothetical protein
LLPFRVGASIPLLSGGAMAAKNKKRPAPFDLQRDFATAVARMLHADDERDFESGGFAAPPRATRKFAIVIGRFCAGSFKISLRNPLLKDRAHELKNHHSREGARAGVVDCVGVFAVNSRLIETFALRAAKPLVNLLLGSGMPDLDGSEQVDGIGVLEPMDAVSNAVRLDRNASE